MIVLDVLLVCALHAIAPSEFELTQSVGPKVHVLRPPIDAARIELWRGLPEERPGRRGFRAPILDRADEPLTLHVPADAVDRVARRIAERLAREGLRSTLVDALTELAASSPEGALPPDPSERLSRAGFPVDLLACWSPTGGAALVERVARDLAAGRKPSDVEAELAALPFAFSPTVPGFRVATECGEHDAAAIRLQVSSATDYAQPGEGGAMDVFRDLARLLPDAELVVGVEAKHLAGVESEARALAENRRAPITLVESALPLAQWVQDNAKVGIVENPSGRAVVWLAPRFASRGEDGTTFVAGENLALEGLAATGRAVRASPLVFQGGNLMAVRDPRDGKRSLLVGEAEIARNRALGLTRNEVLEAFRTEFGVDSCIVLPAVSFHIDLEVSVRATEEGIVACVLDTATAARAILHAGIRAFARAGLLDATSASEADADIEADRLSEFFARIGPALRTGQHASGRFALDFAQHFALGPTDSGVGNLERWLLALDLWTAARIGNATAEEVGVDTDTHAYLTSLRRREVDRVRVATALSELGWKLVAVPGLSDESRGLNPLNGLHLRGLYLMPAYGGLYAPLDELARARFAEAFGAGVRVEFVATGETQRRAGGLHCAAAVEPALNRH